MIFSTAYTAKSNPADSTLLSDLLSNVSDDLLNMNGIFMKIFNMLTKLSVKTEMAALEEHRGLGDERHREEIRQKIINTRNALADCIFLICSNGDSVLQLPETTMILKTLNRVSTLDDDFYVTNRLLTGAITYIDRFVNMYKQGRLYF